MSEIHRRLIQHSPLLEYLDLNGVERLGPGVLAAALHPAAALKRVALARSGLCCDEAVEELVSRWEAAADLRAV